VYPLNLKVLGIALASAGLLCAADSAATRLTDAAQVLNEVMGIPDKSIPRDLLEKSQCVAIIPGLKKGAFIVGAEFGRGFLSCRRGSGNGWSAPAAIRVEGGSFGFQIGGEETDAIMLVMNKSGVRKLLADKFTLGADASVAGGPLGRTSSADTDAQMHAEILTYSRSRGVFAGIALAGATLRPDKNVNTEMYHSSITNKQLVTGRTKPTAAGAKLTGELKMYSAHRS
jgi:lipid-binding SYLF domain-containing protein